MLKFRWKFKLPGRVGDSSMVGSGLFCDGAVGAAVATGDGEEIMRTCLSFLVVESMRSGKSVQEACVHAITRIESLHRDESLAVMHDQLVVGVVAMDTVGNIGAASTLGAHNVHR
jgi:N4-(beta-N-acetylglucosaminyl)-L-asparaginase